MNNPWACHLTSWHDHDTAEAERNCLHCRKFHTNNICVNCGGHIFETDPKISEMEGHIIWSHLEDTKCDDPEPRE
jgi:hypothetical protein